MDALIFDFDGVVVDSEPIHLAGFREVLKDIGLALSNEDYYAKYLGYDDRDGFGTMARDNGVELSPSQLAQMIQRKTMLVQRAFVETIQPLPGAVPLIESVARAGVPVAVCSGALRTEIELASRTIGAWPHFSLIVSAEDVTAGKPDPQGYLLTVERLRQKLGKPLSSERCVVIEDSPAGISAARAAGMKVLAVANSYHRSHLGQADAIVENLTQVTLDTLRQLA
ncbi:MAG: HAD family phosphatase [Phycisphaerae bacterium]